MGKYDKEIIIGTDAEKGIQNCVLILANELAEANRLKIMELRYLGEEVISEKAYKQLCEQVKKLRDEA